MGRQKRQGLDFWLRDVGLVRDPKLRKPRQEFGYLAPYVYECLLDILYGDKGYYIDYRDGERDNVLWQLLELVQGRYAVTVETLASVIDRLAACGLFSGDLYRRGFITSKRAQKGYFAATLSRTAPQIDFDIWLLSEEEMRELNPSGKSFVLQSFITSAKKGDFSVRNNSFSAGKYTEQSREEKSREEKSREEKSRAENSRADETVLTDLISDIERIIANMIDANFRLEIKRLLSVGMTREVVLQAAVRTEDKHPRDPAAYFRRILQAYERDGIWTVSDIEAVKPRRTQKNIGGHEPTGELQDWEKEWLAARKSRREEAQM